MNNLLVFQYCVCFYVRCHILGHNNDPKVKFNNNQKFHLVSTLIKI